MTPGLVFLTLLDAALLGLAAGLATWVLIDWMSR